MTSNINFKDIIVIFVHENGIKNGSHVQLQLTIKFLFSNDVSLPLTDHRRLIDLGLNYLR